MSFSSKVSGDSGAGWGVYEGSCDRDKIDREAFITWVPLPSGEGNGSIGCRYVLFGGIVRDEFVTVTVVLGGRSSEK